jgi:DNA-binding CsgD family transcriptional regulator
MSQDIDMRTYVRELESHLRLTLFDGGVADPEGAVLLVRGALADGDRRKAADLVEAAARLASVMPASTGMAAAADHARGLIERDPATIERAAGAYPILSAQAGALEDAGDAWAAQGDQGKAAARLTQAHGLYKQLGLTHAMARVRSSLRQLGVRLRYWTQVNRPDHGWDSLTDTERLIAGLVAQGCSNREVAAQVYLSVHTVAFHLRHIFWKLDVTSRVDIARLVAEQKVLAAGSAAPPRR